MKTILIKMMCAVVWLLLAIALIAGPLALVCQSETIGDKAVNNSAKYLHVRELTNNNDAPEIDRYLDYLGLPHRLSWCAAFVVYNYHEAADAMGIKNPLPKIGRVATLWEYARHNELKYKTFHPDDIISGLEKMRPGDIIVWLHGSGPNPNGHTGMDRYHYTRLMLATREGNTSAGNKGSQRNGNGVYDRLRPTTGIVGVIRVRYGH